MPAKFHFADPQRFCDALYLQQLGHGVGRFTTALTETGNPCFHSTFPFDVEPLILQAGGELSDFIIVLRTK